jgi:DNA-binding CsgD family transcriptional regulator
VGLVGRTDECKRIDDLLSRARRGESQTLVLHGEAGVGKTALLEYAAAKARDFEVVHLVGFESERQLGFAALQRVLAPVSDLINELPPPQRDALRSALGVGNAAPANIFLVGLALISVAAIMAAKCPLLVVIDDAQWVDSSSLEAFAFWARRIDAEGIALIFATREPNRALDGLPPLAVAGLSSADARALLARSVPMPFDADVSERLVRETGGNPLALIEFARDLSVEQLLGAAGDPRPIPLAGRLEQHFAQQVHSLPEPTRMLLLIAAADSSRERATVWEAASMFGIEGDAIDAAVVSGIVSTGLNVRFKHPLVRSAVSSTATPADRRAVHRALAAVAERRGDAERQAWHLADASIAPDESVAAMLEECAVEAQARGSDSAALALFSRAAELSPLSDRAAERRVSAAAAAVTSGATQQAHTLLALAGPDLRNPAAQTRSHRIAGQAFRHEMRPADAVPLLLTAGVEYSTSQPALARETLLEALSAANMMGNLTPEDRALRDAVANATIDAPRCGDPLIDAMTDAAATWVRDGFATAAPLFRGLLDALVEDEVVVERLLPWVVLILSAARSMWDGRAIAVLSDRFVHAGRRRGALREAGIALIARGELALNRGEVAGAARDYAFAGDVYFAVGETQAATRMAGMELLVHRGNEDAARPRAEALLALGAEMRFGDAVMNGHRWLLSLDLGLARYADALEHGWALYESDPTGRGNMTLPDTIEAAARAGNPDAAHAVLERLRDRATASGTQWALGMLARAQGLVADDAAESSYKESIELLERAGIGFEVARSQLVYGEWLRRGRRPRDAREQLRAAYEAFERMGATGFAMRARTELAATGERARKREVDTSLELTPQEARVAQFAARGNTNSEIAAQLFVSPSTVEYHLHKVFRKLGVKSRTQLARHLLESSS